MRHPVTLLFFIFTFNLSQGQALKKIYTDFLKYGTVYVSGNISNSVEAEERNYFVRTPEDGNLYDIPRVEDNTLIFPHDFRYSIGIRKLARFDYERQNKNFYNGTEKQLAFTAPTSAIQGFEYQIHYEKERVMGREFTNHRVFLKHTDNYHITKIESREVGKIGLDYNSAEFRGRLPIGKKFSISAGVIARGHKRAYGYNPIEIWLNETKEDGTALNPWYSLGFEYGYTDHLTKYTDINTGDVTQDWIWKDSKGNIVSYSDIDFRENVFNNLMNKYNNDILIDLDGFVDVAPIVGFDFYHFKNKFWIHTYGNYILPYHKYVMGDKDLSYLNRNNWGKGGLVENSEPEQWDDYSAGLNFGWKVGKKLGIFIEGEYSKMWDSKLFQTSVGLNYTFR